MSAAPTIPELVAYTLFDLDPRVEAAQRPVHTFLVSLALLDAAEGLDDGEIHAEILGLLPLDPPSVSEDDVVTAIELHLDHDLVHRDGAGRLHLSAGRRSQLEEARSRLASRKRAFHSHMRDAAEERAPELTDKEQERLFHRLENQLVELLQIQSSAVAAAWAAGGEGFDKDLPDLNAREHLVEIANAMVPGAAVLNKLRRAAIAKGLEIGLKSIPPEGAAYLAALYQRTVAMALLQQDPTVRRVKSHLAGRRIAYLDANVVLAAMFDVDERHETALQVLELTRALGAELCVTAFTVAEIGLRIGEATRWMSQYRGRSDLRGHVNDVVVRSFHRATRDTPGLVWSAFIAGFDPPAAWLKEHRIAIDSAGHQETESDHRVGDVISALQRVRPTTNAKILETDAHNILHVVRMRKGVGRDEMGNRVWLVTQDRAIAKAERALVDDGVLDAASSRLASDWIDLLSPCLPPDEDRLSSYVAHLVSSQFSLLAEDPIFVEKQFLLTLQRARFKISEVLGASTERARQILINLQRSRELEELLGEPNHDDDWNEAIEEAIRRALQDLEYSPEAKAELRSQEEARRAAEERASSEHREWISATRALATARGNAEVLRRESEVIARERDDLSEQLDIVRALPWWRRLFGRY
jgi:hypothetical protein